MGRIIKADVIGQKLMDAGIVPSNCTRIIIDLELDNVAKVYCQCLGDTKLLDFDWGVELGEVKAVSADELSNETIGRTGGGR